eukprot:15384612-Alexandrium_andersonii.AAC.1
MQRAFLHLPATQCATCTHRWRVRAPAPSGCTAGYVPTCLPRQRRDAGAQPSAMPRHGVLDGSPAERARRR